MIVSLQVAAIAGLMAVASTPVMAQTTGTLPAQPPPYGVAPPPSQPPTANQFSSNEVIDAGHRFFGGVSRGLAEIVEKAVSQWGLPNGYVLGQEASGAFIGGLRYGDGTLYTRNAGDVRVFWQGPSVGFDAGADGARTMMAGLQPAAGRSDFRSLRRHQRLGLLHWWFRHDGAYGK